MEKTTRPTTNPETSEENTMTTKNRRGQKVQTLTITANETRIDDEYNGHLIEDVERIGRDVRFEFTDGMSLASLELRADMTITVLRPIDADDLSPMSYTAEDEAEYNAAQAACFTG
jgi:hypothetical protein